MRPGVVTRRIAGHLAANPRGNFNTGSVIGDDGNRIKLAVVIQVEVGHISAFHCSGDLIAWILFGQWKWLLGLRTVGGGVVGLA